MHVAERVFFDRNCTDEELYSFNVKSCKEGLRFCFFIDQFSLYFFFKSNSLFKTFHERVVT